jgi:hypothetical protein
VGKNCHSLMDNLSLCITAKLISDFSIFTLSSGLNSSLQRDVPKTLLLYTRSLIVYRNMVSQENIFSLCTTLLFFSFFLLPLCLLLCNTPMLLASTTKRIIIIIIIITYYLLFGLYCNLCSFHSFVLYDWSSERDWYYVISFFMFWNLCLCTIVTWVDSGPFSICSEKKQMQHIVLRSGIYWECAKYLCDIGSNWIL